MSSETDTEITRRDFGKIVVATTYAATIGGLGLAQLAVPVTEAQEQLLVPQIPVGKSNTHFDLYLGTHLSEGNARELLKRREIPYRHILFEEINGLEHLIGRAGKDREFVDEWIGWQEIGGKNSLPLAEYARDKNATIWMPDIQMLNDTQTSKLLIMTNLPKILTMFSGGFAAYKLFLDKINVDGTGRQAVELISSLIALYVTSPGAALGAAHLSRNRNVQEMAYTFIQTLYPFYQDTLRDGRDMVFAMKMHLLERHKQIEGNDNAASWGSAHFPEKYLRLSTEELLIEFEKYLPVLLTVYKPESLYMIGRINNIRTIQKKTISDIDVFKFPELEELVEKEVKSKER